MPTDLAQHRPDRRERPGLALWKRLALVAALHGFLLVGIWWAFNPSPTRNGAEPGVVPWWLAAPVPVLAFLLLLQVSVRLPKLLVGVAMVLAAATPISSMLGIDAVAERTMMTPALGTVERQEVLFAGQRRLYLTVDGVDEIAYSTLRKRGASQLYVSYWSGDRVYVLIDPAGRVYNRVTSRPGSDYPAPVAGALGLAAALSWVGTELICVSALTRRRSLMMGRAPADGWPDEEPEDA